MKLRVVLSGLVATCAVTPDGRRQILYLATPGDAICTLFSEGSECWCEALAPSEICEFEVAPRANPFHQSPEFAQVLFRRMHEHFEKATGHMLALGRFDGMERICTFIADLTRRTGKQYGDTWHVRLPMSRRDIADYLGLNTDTVSRLITRVRKERLILFRSHDQCEIPDLARLEARVPIVIGPVFKETGRG